MKIKFDDLPIQNIKDDSKYGPQYFNAKNDDERSDVIRRARREYYWLKRNAQIERVRSSSRKDLKYGFYDGDPIELPRCWELIPEGDYIPHNHMEFDYWHGFWLDERRGHSTGTPPFACICGHVVAFARKIDIDFQI